MMRKNRVLGLTAVVAASLIAQFALLDVSGAATQQQAATQQETPQIDIRAWNNANIYDGWSARALLGEPVYGTGGKVLGNVSDLIIGPDGAVQRVVVEGGGVRETTGSLYAVPWNAAKRVSSAGVDLPVGEGNISGYGQYPKLADLPPDESNFTLTEMIGKGVKADGTDFGTIRDVIFSNRDKLVAVVVIPAQGAGAPHGPIAFPYNPDYFEKQKPYYSSPYPRETLNELRPFDYDELK